ncbi:diguanylate cyclase [uncultured Marinococcus sp.]|uniref:GGDEF domain-containing protein n=1 Tax=uncultured Marinococcus sp. TaxID=487012 RepID=UPI002634FA7F|nr:GGDEF domain-containing protein [uncultured Marinococcus sp.]
MQRMRKSSWEAPGFEYIFRFLSTERERAVLYTLYLLFVGVLFFDSIVVVDFPWPVLIAWLMFISAGLYLIRRGFQRQQSMLLTFYVIGSMGWWAGAVIATGGVVHSPLVHYGQVLWVLSALSASWRLNVAGGTVFAATLLASLSMSMTRVEMLEAGGVVAIHGLTLAFGCLAAVAVHRHRIWITHWQEQAHTDDLTGLANRSGWLNWWKQKAPTDGWIGIIDLNNFKTMNDTYGHECGDQVLMAMAEELQATLPPESSAARIGGDEFMIYLPSHMSEAEAVETVRQLAQSAGQTMQLPITAALGLARITPEHCDFQELYRRADAHMYQQKQSKASFTMNPEAQNRKQI